MEPGRLFVYGRGEEVGSCSTRQRTRWFAKGGTCTQSRNTTPSMIDIRRDVCPSPLPSACRYNALVSLTYCVNYVESDGRSKPFQSTYYDARMRASPALLRARAPYLVKNTITGAAVVTLVISICA